jgi:hypothetical protein
MLFSLNSFPVRVRSIRADFVTNRFFEYIIHGLLTRFLSGARGFPESARRHIARCRAVGLTANDCPIALSGQQPGEDAFCVGSYRSVLVATLSAQQGKASGDGRSPHQLL